jgi:hypothetical protein
MAIVLGRAPEILRIRVCILPDVALKQDSRTNLCPNQDRQSWLCQSMGLATGV